MCLVLLRPGIYEHLIHIYVHSVDICVYRLIYTYTQVQGSGRVVRPVLLRPGFPETRNPKWLRARPESGPDWLIYVPRSPPHLDPENSNQVSDAEVPKKIIRAFEVENLVAHIATEVCEPYIRALLGTASHFCEVVP